MGYLLFLAIAFVLVGVDRLVHLARGQAARHGHVPRS